MEKTNHELLRLNRTIFVNGYSTPLVSLSKYELEIRGILDSEYSFINNTGIRANVLWRNFNDSDCTESIMDVTNFCWTFAYISYLFVFYIPASKSAKYFLSDFEFYSQINILLGNSALSNGATAIHDYDLLSSSFPG